MSSAAGSSLTRTSPWSRRFVAWADERFPAIHGVLSFVLYAAVLVFSRALTHDGPLELGARDLPGFLALWAFFLMLRVFDEHKDYALDCRNFPDRVLQRGLVTLDDLKIVGALAVALQLVVSLWLDRGFGAVTGRWLVVMGWSALMAKEFFVGSWLSRRLVLYAVSHMVVMPLAILWIAQMGAGARPLPGAVWLLAALSFFLGAAFEVTRKMKGPEEEREGVDSYTRVLGTTRAALVVAALVIAAGLLFGALLSRVASGVLLGLACLVLTASLVAALAAMRRFRQRPSAAARKRNEAAVGLFMLAGNATLALTVVLARGVA